MELYHLVFQSLILLDHRGQLLFEFGNPPVVPAGLGLALSELSEKLRYLFHATFAAVVLLVFVDAGRFSLDRGRVSNTLCLKLSQLNPRPGFFPARKRTFCIVRVMLDSGLVSLLSSTYLSTCLKVTTAGGVLTGSAGLWALFLSTSTCSLKSSIVVWRSSHRASNPSMFVVNVFMCFFPAEFSRTNRWLALSRS